MIFQGGDVSQAMALDAVTAAVIGAVAVVFFLMFLFLRRIITSFTQGYKEGR